METRTPVVPPVVPCSLLLHEGINSSSSVRKDFSQDWDMKNEYSVIRLGWELIILNPKIINVDFIRIVLSEHSIYNNRGRRTIYLT